MGIKPERLGMGKLTAVNESGGNSRRRGDRGVDIETYKCGLVTRCSSVSAAGQDRGQGTGDR